MDKKDKTILIIALLAIVLNSIFMWSYLGYEMGWIFITNAAIVATGINAWQIINAITISRQAKEKPMYSCNYEWIIRDGKKLIAAYHYYKLTGVLRKLPERTIEVAAKYDELIHEELEELISFAIAHGWKSRRQEEGENYRRLITQHMYPDEQ